MKTRDQIYKEEGTVLLRLITTYHALRYDQVLQFFPRNHNSLRTLITNLIKQGRLYYDRENELLCDRPESAVSPDYGIIAAFWILLDFKKNLIYHIIGEFPIKLHFFSQDEAYEICIRIVLFALARYMMKCCPANGYEIMTILNLNRFWIRLQLISCWMTPDYSVIPSIRQS